MYAIQYNLHILTLSSQIPTSVLFALINLFH